MVTRWILGLILLGGLFLAGYHLLGGDRDLRAIQRQSARLVEALHKSPGDGMLALADRAHRIAGYFAGKPTVVPGDPLPALQSQEEITSMAARTFHVVKSLNVRLLDSETSWTHPHTEAAMRVAVEVMVEGAGEQQTAMHTYELKWIREDGTWVIASAQPAESIRRPAGSTQ